MNGLRVRAAGAASTAFRLALIGGAIGVLTELVVPILAPAFGLLGLPFVVLLYYISLPLWLMTHSSSLPIWVPPLNLALWGFALGAIIGWLVPAKTKGESKGR